MASFDGRLSSFSSVPPTQHAPYAHMTTQSSPPQPPPQMARSSQSFGPINGYAPQHHPQIYTAVYSGVAVYEMEVAGVAVMRRRSDSWLNATQILKVASVDKGKRTKILEKEIHQGHHEKVQGGYGRYQGTWISHERGRQFCRQYGVEDILRPLLEYDLANDGAGSKHNTLETPTKEQAMAANRKRFYNNAAVADRSSAALTGNTFFQGISPTTSNAIAAMTKAAKYDGGLHRPGSSNLARKPSLIRQSSSQQVDSQGSGGMPASQSSTHSFAGQSQEQTVNVNSQTYGSQQYGAYHPEDFIEPPRKRLRPESSQDMTALDPALNDETPTEPNESFVASQPVDTDAGPTTMPPLMASTDSATDVKRRALIALFNDNVRNDPSSHPALASLSGRDLDTPLDTSANTALHWASTLARVPIMRMLIAKGANIYQGNAANQTALMATVQVKNSYDFGLFPEILEILGGLIDIRDTTGRTVLHHIAISSGIKGRAAAAKYYLESLLEFTVKQGSNPSQLFTDVGGQKKPAMNLTRFMSTVVNAQDKNGNTALNLVARVGSRAIINQLEEVGADFEIANVMGFKSSDFGFHPRNQAPASQTQRTEESSQESLPASQVELIHDEIVATTNTILAQTKANYESELSKKKELIAKQNEELQAIAVEYEQEQARYQELQRRTKERMERQQKIQNHRRANDDRRFRVESKTREVAHLPAIGDLNPATADYDGFDLSNPVDVERAKKLDASEALELLKKLPRTTELQALLSAHTTNNDRMAEHLAALKQLSSQLEGKYRRVVSLCCGVPEGEVDGMLGALLAAVASERGEGTDLSRVREFLRKVEGAEGSV